MWCRRLKAAASAHPFTSCDGAEVHRAGCPRAACTAPPCACREYGMSTMLHRATESCAVLHIVLDEGFCPCVLWGAFALEATRPAAAGSSFLVHADLLHASAPPLYKPACERASSATIGPPCAAAAGARGSASAAAAASCGAGCDAACVCGTVRLFDRALHASSMCPCACVAAHRSTVEAEVQWLRGVGWRRSRPRLISDSELPHARAAKPDGPASRTHKIGIFGGSYNPPTRGHIEVAKQALECGCSRKPFAQVAPSSEPAVDEVWLVPCGPRPDKPSLQVSVEDRVIMTTLAVIGSGVTLPIHVVPLEAFEKSALASYVTCARTLRAARSRSRPLACTHRVAGMTSCRA
ncbi:hypothetical protein EON66_02515 [archaeon]|nr:MAG: hypothetical protein EON66_02515 [archaeon]